MWGSSSSLDDPVVSHSLLSAFSSCGFSFSSFMIWTSSLRMVADVAAAEW